MTKRTPKLATGLVEKYALPYGYGHVAIVRDRLNGVLSNEFFYSTEIYNRRTYDVARVRGDDKLRDARKHLMDIHAGACHMLHALADGGLLPLDGQNEVRAYRSESEADMRQAREASPGYCVNRIVWGGPEPEAEAEAEAEQSARYERIRKQDYES